MDIHSMSCCGFRELADIEVCDTPEEVIQAFCGHFATKGYDYLSGKYIEKRFRLFCSHAVFTEVQGDGGYGRKLAAYIRKHKLGTVVGSRVATNPNSDNRLRGYIWTINPRALEGWWKANKDKK